jgi:hypothetical protein
MPRGLAFLSAAGSVASIVALLVVLLQQAAGGPGGPTQFVVWRFILAAIGLVGTGGVAVLAYGYSRGVQLSGLPFHTKVLRICLTIVIALVAIGVCLDGFFAALYWTPWLWIIVRLFL